jgi:hypothetical protein
LVTETLDRGWQLVETEDRALLDEWIANCSDFIDLENLPHPEFERSGAQNHPRL